MHVLFASATWQCLCSSILFFMILISAMCAQFYSVVWRCEDVKQQTLSETLFKSKRWIFYFLAHKLPRVSSRYNNPMSLTKMFGVQHPQVGHGRKRPVSTHSSTVACFRTSWPNRNNWIRAYRLPPSITISQQINYCASLDQCGGFGKTFCEPSSRRGLSVASHTGKAAHDWFQLRHSKQYVTKRRIDKPDPYLFVELSLDAISRVFPFAFLLLLSLDHFRKLLVFLASLGDDLLPAHFGSPTEGWRCRARFFGSKVCVQISVSNYCLLLFIEASFIVGLSQN